ncbi:META domain-containing protein [Kribbella italica]|uniref:Heat shock protein HslJ n=1 Tax=Kribbella italica TaxID=1540520 RepID=A0A7W9J9J0_9ACTN|nr:META domain-containing protein [Kribbella italica]MBB5838084.1 heat shock protein HslJ [Kribbella italica]
MAAAGLVALTGCGEDVGASGLGGKTYLSTALTENGAPKKLAPSTRISLMFKDDGSLSANAGCNSIGGKASTDGGTLTVGDLNMTNMACDAPRQQQEDWLLELLKSKPAWKLAADKLTITAGGTVLELQDRETAQPDVALDGTKWVLESVIAGETASTPGNGGAYLTLNGGRVTGSTSCNDLQGAVARTGDKLTFGEIGTTRRACSGEAGALEKTVLATLNGEVSYTLDADKLQLRTPAGNGLDFKAAG